MIKPEPGEHYWVQHRRWRELTIGLFASDAMYGEPGWYTVGSEVPAPAEDWIIVSHVPEPGGRRFKAS